MTLNELASIASEAYADGIIAAEYWDFKGERPRRNMKGGDTLAFFIANEIAETYDNSAIDEEKMAAVVRALSTAQREIGAVIAAFAKEMKKRSSLAASDLRGEKEPQS